jgi:hypothetical protein
MDRLILFFLFFLIMVFLIAIIVLIIQLKRRDIFHATIASLMGILVVLIGQLGKPEVNGIAKLHLSLGSVFSIDSDTVTVTTNTSTLSWALALLSIVSLLIFCLSRIKDKPKKP